MEKFKEFEDKSLDDAIRAACKFFEATREKLEIELVQDAKNGIFGLVGARKALIRARLQQAASTVKNLKQKGMAKESSSGSGKAFKPKDNKGHKPSRERLEEGAIKNEPPASEPSSDKSQRDANAADAQKRTVDSQNEKKQKASRQDQTGLDDHALNFDSGEFSEDNVASLYELDQDTLIAKTKEVVKKLAEPIVGEIAIDVTVFENRVDAHIDCGEFSGLIIGREGQTLASLQYLSSRILTRLTGCLVRIQFDVGDYRERQDDKLRQIALSLAERARTNKRPCSTRPMTSYHRRVIHTALQGFPDIYTRSSGAGVLKRVVVCYKRQAK